MQAGQGRNQPRKGMQEVMKADNARQESRTRQAGQD
jgi:hypothetical protein